MKIKEGYMLHQVADNYLIVAYGEESKRMTGTIRLNVTGAEIWRMIEEGKDESAIAEGLTERFDVTREDAAVHTRAFIGQLEELGLIEN